MTEENHAIRNAESWMESIRKMVDVLNARGADEEAARTKIEESALSVQVRGGWYSLGAEDKGGPPEEFEILLTRGGPALRIIGDLDGYGQPEKPRLQWQDWGTPWSDFTATSEQDDEALLAFCQVFYFGEGGSTRSGSILRR